MSTIKKTPTELPAPGVGMDCPATNLGVNGAVEPYVLQTTSFPASANTEPRTSDMAAPAGNFNAWDEGARRMIEEKGGSYQA